jgi:hypothetical protein
VQYYGELLNSLKVLGASLSFIKPESLLSADEFRHWWRSKLKKSQREGNLTAANLQREEYYTKLELNFKYVSLESWIHLLMQVGKLFAIDKITIKHLRNLPGVVIRDDEQNPPPILSKHVLSHSENVLLKWASSSYHRSTGIWKKINNFEQDFRDGTVIAHVLVAYLSELQIPACMKNIVWLCDGEEDFAQNQRLLIQALNELFSSKTSESKISLSGNDKVGQIEFGNIKLGDLYGM